MAGSVPDITIEELRLSRSLTLGDSGSGTLKYRICGTDDEGDAKDALVAEAPSVFQGLLRKNCTVEPLHIDTLNPNAC